MAFITFGLIIGGGIILLSGIVINKTHKKKQHNKNLNQERQMQENIIDNT